VVNKFRGRVSCKRTAHSTQPPNSWRELRDRSEYNSPELASSTLSLDIDHSKEEELLIIFDHCNEEEKGGDMEGERVGSIKSEGKSVGSRWESR
jgi:hypothetical protein